MNPTAQELHQARAIIADSPVALANLALLGDKRLLFSASGQSFVMYGARGGSWIVLGDPVGPEAERRALIGGFVGACRRQRKRPVFYRVGGELLAEYRGHGLLPVKLGEDAVVELDARTVALSGHRLANLRHSAARAARQGCSFEVVEAAAVPALLPALATLSAGWLARKRGREKRFSVGCFDPAYLAQFPLCLVRLHDVPVAFANIWLAGGHGEMMVDLMRRDPRAPYGAMDYLFAGLIGWGAAAGYRRLNLGLAPLSGLDGPEVGAAWRGCAGLAERHGGRFYNFAGLRRFKAKFAPRWVPRYLVCRGGLARAPALLDTALIAAGGWRGLIGK